MYRLFLVLFFMLGILSCKAELGIVSRVIDGDTFELESGEKVRLIGINAPEISDYYGKESKCFLEKMLLLKQVELIDDPISSKYDRYQRKLCYVFVNGVEINAVMLNEGYAFAYLKFKFSKSIEYENFQLDAMKNNKGIWGYGEKSLSKNNSSEEIQQDVVSDSYCLFSKKVILGALVIVLIVMFFCFLLKR